jgi:peptidyl-prolyl cis-trans isomerase D
MLEAIRKRTASFVIKLLFLVLVLSFVVWGIGDVISPNRGPDWAAQVGDVTVPAEAFRDEYRQVVGRLSRAVGKPLDPQEARALGLPQSILARQVERALLDQTASDLGILVSDDLVRSVIVTTPQFLGPDGQFDANAFRNALQSSGMSESAFVASLRSQIGRDLVTQSLRAGVAPPSFLVRQIDMYMNERRHIAFVRVPRSAMTDIGEPSDLELRQYYGEHGDAFMQPEHRTITAIVLRPDDLAGQTVVSEDELRRAYDDRLDELRAPETRTFEQALFDNEADSQTALARLREGRDFAAVTAEILGQPPEDVVIRDVTRDSLPSDLGYAVFSAPVGTISAPIQTSFGWHIIRVMDVTPAVAPSFETVRENLRVEIAEERAVETVLELGTRIEDELASGATLEDTAARLGIPVSAGLVIDAEARDLQGNAVADLPESLVDTAFSLALGEESLLEEADDNTYFVVRVDGIEEARRRDFENVREQVRDAWMQAELGARAQVAAEKMADAVRGGQSLQDVAAARGFDVTTPPPMRRDDAGADPTIPLILVNRLFEQPDGEPAVIETADAAYLGLVTQVDRHAPAGTSDDTTAVGQQISVQMREDVIRQLLSALQRSYDVTINDRVLEQL